MRVRGFEVAAFAFLMTIIVFTAPVLAADAPFIDPQAQGPTAGDDPERVFDGGVVPVDFATFDREEAERRQWLATPEAVRQREASLLAYADLTPEASEALLRETFSEQLAALNADPGRFLSESDVRLTQPAGPTAGAVEDNGEHVLLDGSVPLRAREDDGRLAEVDLTLERTAQGFATDNGHVELALPAAADEAMQIGADGFAVAQAGAREAAARRYGDKNLFYPEVLSDTDLMVATTSGGIETFNLLRSRESPEQLRFAVELPEDSTLRSDDFGGAEVVREGEVLNRISAPIAFDAQGTKVAVEMQIERAAIVLRIAHREEDLAYPLLVDPIFEEWAAAWHSWYEGKNLHVLTNGAWAYSRNNGTIYQNTCCWGGVHAGLMVSTTANAFYNPHQFGQWSYSTGNLQTYITSAWINKFWRYDETCGSSFEPHDYAGMLWMPGEIWNPVQINAAKNYNEFWTNGNGHAFILGLGTGGPGVWIACGRHLYAGGVSLRLDDQWAPTASVIGIPPEKWLGVQAVNFQVHSSDDGLGVQSVEVLNDGKGTVGKDNVGFCTGLYGNRCPTSHVSYLGPTTASFGDGIRNSSVIVRDPTGKTHETFFKTMVDRSKPSVQLSGQFAEATEADEGEAKAEEEVEKLPLPVYNLTINATDIGDHSDPEKRKRSGVREIRVVLDGKSPPEKVWTEPCGGPDYSCSMERTYQLKLSEKLATVGKHTLEVDVEDHAGNVRERNIEFEYFPATGMKDEYMMHYFPLPDGSGDEAEEENPRRPELAVNVMNGNLVYRQRDVDIEGTAALDLEVERFYNSQLPAGEDTEWGEGWTLGQTPELDLVKAGGSPVPNQADVLEQDGAIEGGVGVPTEAGASKFDPALQATITKKASGGYELADETGEAPGRISFDATGQAEALADEGHAKVDYKYDAGELAEIEVSDPATFSADPSELEIPEPQLIAEPIYASSFGSNGAGDGQVKSPADVAIDAQGNLWVVDKGNNRVQKFDANGNFLARFGSIGSGDGQFNRPTSIAIAANGDLLVTDSGNARVQRFSPSGAFLSKFGAKGSGDGQFAGSGPEGVAVAPNGEIWVSDTYGGRIQKFSAAGAFLQSVGTKGSGPGQLGEPTGIDVDAQGYVWVADWQNHRVSVFDAAGEFEGSFGSNGSGDGQFKNPDAVEVDELGNVWVGDQTNRRVQQFDLEGQFKAKFGSAGSGPGQFNFSYPMDIGVDSKGNLWVADVNNHRIQHWRVPLERPAYLSSFGAGGSGDGQLAGPSDVALGVDGNLLVVDRGNNRIQRFDRDGNYVGQFGSVGSGEGQLNRPTSIAVDRDGNVLVTDSGNHRVQKFTAEGQFIAAFGVQGTEDGQFSSPEGIATDFEGNVWVADTGNGRVQKFDEDGQFLSVVGSKGEEPGQLARPVGIDVDAEGNVWVADWTYRRVSVFDGAGQFLGLFGSQGSGPGQFSRPGAVDIDRDGNVWIADHGNNRVQRFDLEGDFVGQFGSSGNGAGQFSLPGLLNRSGIATDTEGRIWVADLGNQRIQQWQLGNYAVAPQPPLDLGDGDAKVEIETEGGLVASVSGNAAGTHTYEHDGDFLISHDGPQGETVYESDPTTGKLSKVTLPNGSYGAIAYYGDGRVKSVTVTVEGANPKTTSFYYTDSPNRKTVVDPPDAPHLTYDIAGDGSVLKWWNTAEPPELELAGNLYDYRENKNGGLWPDDFELEASTFDAEGIASVQVILNGTTLVDELTCEEEGPPSKCVEPENLHWVTETEAYPPGRLDIEVIATDNDGESAAERFWVDIPEPAPPLAPGTPVPPRFSEIKRFREEYGLEIVFPVANETEEAERIFSLIKAWKEPDTPLGQVARASRDRWGVPLRPADVAELEYREWYIEHNGPRIQVWGESHHPNTYGGYWLDHRAGGLIRVGVVGGSSPLPQLEATPGLVALDRFADFAQAPSHPISALASLQVAIGRRASESPLAGLVTGVGLDIPSNKVSVGATNVAAATEALSSIYGSAAPFTVHYEPSTGKPTHRRYENAGLVYGGQIIAQQVSPEPDDRYRLCTAGFGARDKLQDKPNGQPAFAQLLLTAGHCFGNGDIVKRVLRKDADGDLYQPRRIGEQRGRDWRVHTDGAVKFESDGAAVVLGSGDLVTNGVLGRDGSIERVNGASVAEIGQTLCVSLGHTNAVRCQPMHKPAAVNPGWAYGIPGAGPFWQLTLVMPGEEGDSGSPVWSPRTGKAVGINVFGPPVQITPLLPPPLPEKGFYPWDEVRRSDATGLLNEPFMGDGIHVVAR